MVEGTRWLVDWLVSRKGRAASIVIDGKSGAGALYDALIAAKVSARRIIRPTIDQVISAHAGLVQAVVDGELSHIDDEVLTASIASAGRRAIGKAGGWGFAPIDDGDVTLAESIVLAHFGAMSARPVRPGRSGPQRRKAVLI